MSELDKYIPDFDDMQNLVTELAKVKGRIVLLKAKLERKESEYVTEALDNREYWKEGKKPTITYCNSVVRQIGNTDEEKELLTGLREELAQLQEQKELLIGLLDLYKGKLDLFRTLSANERKGYM